MDTEKTAQPFDPASFEHVPVLLNECLDGLKIDPAGTYLDGTALWSSWALKRSTARCSIWGCPAISWMTQPGAFPTGQMPRWTCG